MRLDHLVYAVLLCFVLWGHEAFALDRAALTLSGSDCALAQPAIISILERLEGVAQVDADLIPNHLLVDHDGQRRTGEELAGVVNAVVAPSGRCRATVMQSCVTAGTGTGTVRSAPKR